MVEDVISKPLHGAATESQTGPHKPTGKSTVYNHSQTASKEISRSNCVCHLSFGRNFAHANHLAQTSNCSGQVF